MKSIYILLTFILLAPVAHLSPDETILKVFYWRAFDGSIEVVMKPKLVQRKSSKATYTSGKGWEHFEYSDEVEVVIKEITRNEVETVRKSTAQLEKVMPLIDKAFELSVSKDFRYDTPKSYSDGSTVAIAVSQNLAQAAVLRRVIFTETAIDADKELAELVKSVLELSDYNVQDMKLY